MSDVRSRSPVRAKATKRKASPSPPPNGKDKDKLKDKKPVEKRGRKGGSPIVEETLLLLQSRVMHIDSQQREMMSRMSALEESVESLRHQQPPAAAEAQRSSTTDEDVNRLKKTLLDACDNLGSAVVSLHKDFSVLLRHLGPSFETLLGES